MQFSYTICHVPGEATVCSADALNRCPTKLPSLSWREWSPTSQPSVCNCQQMRSIWKSTAVHRCRTHCAAGWLSSLRHDGWRSSRYSLSWSHFGRHMGLLTDDVVSNVEKLVQQCPQCSKSLVPTGEPLMPTVLPALSLEKVGGDWFEFWGSTYLVVIDYLERRCDMYWHMWASMWKRTKARYAWF